MTFLEGNKLKTVERDITCKTNATLTEYGLLIFINML